MKTLLSVFFLAGSLYASAIGSKEKSIVNNILSKNLAAQFGFVENVEWHNAANNMTKAEFELDDEKISAWFDASGEFVAQTKQITLAELPRKIKATLNEKAPGAEVLSIIEMETDAETAWFVETVADNEHKLWKGNSSGRLARYYTRK